MIIASGIEALFVDVDGTLVFWEGKPGRMVRGVPQEHLHQFCTINQKLIEALKHWKDSSKFLAVWSMGGKEHADWAVLLTGLESIVDATLPKPCAIVDDGTRRWNRHLKFFNQLGLESL